MQTRPHKRCGSELNWSNWDVSQQGQRSKSLLKNAKELEARDCPAGLCKGMSFRRVIHFLEGNCEFRNTPANRMQNRARNNLFI